MPYQIVWNNNGAHAQFTGAIDKKTVGDCDREITGSTQFISAGYAIYNFLDIESIDMSVPEAHELGVADSFTSLLKKGFNLAIVNTDPAIDILTENYSQFTELAGSDWQVKTFKSLKSAEAWCSKSKLI